MSGVAMATLVDLWSRTIVRHYMILITIFATLIMTLRATSNKHYSKVFQFMILRIQVPECKKLSEYIFIIIGSLTAVGQIEAIKLNLIDRHSQFYLFTR